MVSNTSTQFSRVCQEKNTLSSLLLQLVRSYIIFGLYVKVMTICTIIHLHTAFRETLPNRFVNAGQERSGPQIFNLAEFGASVPHSAICSLTLSKSFLTYHQDFSFL